MLRLRAERIKHAWTLKVVSQATGIAISDLSKFETGRAIPYPSQLHRLAAWYKLADTPEVLLQPIGRAPKETP